MIFFLHFKTSHGKKKDVIQFVVKLLDQIDASLSSRNQLQNLTSLELTLI